MIGIIFNELQKYVEEKVGGSAWNELLEQASLGTRTYAPMRSYPDEEVTALVGAASAKTGLRPDVVLEDFGAFVAPSLIQTYSAKVRPEWGALDFLENTERHIHTMVRIQMPNAAPARLTAVRETPKRLVIRYDSQRKLCALARGIIRGVARHYEERLDLVEPRCMHRGDAACVIEVTVPES